MKPRKYAEQIVDLETAKKARVEAMAALNTQSELEGREMNETEQASFDDHNGHLCSLEKRIEGLRILELQSARLARPVIDPDPSDEPGSVHPRRVARAKGTFYAAMAHCQYASRRRQMSVVDYARAIGDDEMAAVLGIPDALFERAAAVLPGSTVDATYAAPLVAIRHAAAEFIELLRATSIMAQMDTRGLTFGREGSVSIPRGTSGISGGFAAQLGAIPVERQGYDSVTMSPKKYAGLTVVANELLERSEPAILTLIQSDMVEGTARGLDVLYMDATAGDTTRPAGMRNGAGTRAGTAGADLAAIDTDFKTILGAFDTALIDTKSLVWILAPAQMRTLQFIRDGLGQYVYKAEVANGVLFGGKLIASTSQAAGVVTAIAQQQALVATNGMGPVIDMSGEAVIHMETAPAADLGGVGDPTPIRSMFQTDAQAIRIKLILDWVKRRAAAVQSCTAVSW